MLRTLTAATSTPVTLDEVLQQIGRTEAEATDDLDLLERLIEDATDVVAGELDQVLAPTDLEERRPCWWSGCWSLAIGPVRDVEGVYYVDANGDEQALEAGEWAWEATHAGADVWLTADATRPSHRVGPGSVRIAFAAGFNDPAATAGEARLDLPRRIRLAVLMLVAHWYRDREAEGDIPDGVKTILSGPGLKVYR